jgi:large subunit ribosomal protein L22
MNTYTATQKFVRMTPRKLRLIADSIRKLTPAQAIEVLPYSARFAADPVLKVVKTAVANARQGGADESKLIFSEVMISEGPALKRGYQVSRGQWHPFKKKMAHIRVVVTEKIEKPIKQTEKVEEAKVEEVKKAAPKKTVKKQIKK